MKTLKIAALAGIIALAGCSSSDVKNTPASSGGSKSSASDTSKPSSGDSSASSLTKSYGSTFTWDDGVALTASKPQPYTFSDPTLPGMMGSRFKKFVVVEFTAKNGSKKPYPPMTLTFTATSGDKQSEALFDSSKGVDLPTADILPGQTLKWKEVFGVNDSGELTMGVENGFGNAKGYYK